jgi:ATP-dependent helicase/nuclease subunit B
VAGGASFIRLFDDLNLNQKQLFNSAEEWQEQLQQAYGLEQEHQHLLYESKLVFTLWHAWQQQLNESHLIDETADYIARLQHVSLQNPPSILKQNDQFICIGYSQYSKTEQEFIQHLVEKNQCQIIDYLVNENAADNTEDSVNNSHHQHALSDFIHAALTPSSTRLTSRATNFANQYKKTILPFSTYLAKNDEEQVRAIDLFVRQNLLNGKDNIAIVSEDRKLSRRLRALLERANVPLNDKAGWSLATTQASTVIERWLECIEEDFNAYPLLDCLKSPFVKITDNIAATDDFQKNIYRLEHDIIFHENISSNIQQYKEQLKRRLNRLSHWPQNSYKELIDTLNFIQDSAKDLSVLHTIDTKILLSDFFNTLLNSLDKLGVLAEYQKDAAGLRLLETFEHLKHSLHYADPLLSWQDCRTWLGLALEAEHFTPTATRSPVQLMTLEQSAYLNFDCVIIAATESQHFPGSPNSSPFFNQAVRASLELTTWEQQSEQRKILFQRALLSAPTILLSACNEENGEEKPVSPWLELLISFHQLAFQRSTENKQLATLVQAQLVHSQHEVSPDDEIDNALSDRYVLPEKSSQANSVLPVDLIPDKISASAYQRLINCPYQYFSADGLQLKPREEISDELKKSDYGERIHLILQCFHNGHDKYGKAYPHLITVENRVQAEDFLSTLSEKIFLQDLDNNILHRSWLYRWQKHIPAYINWQIKQQIDWKVFQSEKNMEVNLNANDNALNKITVYGRLDRIDQNRQDNSQTVIDYKTGKSANQKDVDSGENVQLSTYAMLDKKASVVSYLSLDSSYQKVETKAFLSGDDLETNREQNEQRLTELFNQMQKQEALPAWGNDNVCRYCNFSGLCRKQEWAE